jgi:hypothetical protein
LASRGDFFESDEAAHIPDKASALAACGRQRDDKDLG